MVLFFLKLEPRENWGALGLASSLLAAHGLTASFPGSWLNNEALRTGEVVAY